ncbi:hypothetical protein L1S35_12760 [Flavobacterium sp. AS60]|uniref:hypothetical protein n=1 Tax=Flavobacterium anseongense TaxID=2910677 RepID=UPI001F25BB47|nr:hypothetical protein [Flavobacterium sp. AS60]MCF6130548.1 hypothetical protein [Flavobacterium sp. AS60]
MIEKLEDLKSRAEKLMYNDKNELDDIQRKTKLYLEKIFPGKFTYAGEVDRISFYPSFYVSGMGNQPNIDAWKRGNQELINLLDTRIEEAKLISVKPKEKSQNVQIVEKIVQVEDYKRINELTEELNAVKAKKSLWERINYFALGGIILTLIGGSFYLGKYFGENRFDKEKIDLLFENKDLTKKNDSLVKELDIKKSELLQLEKTKKQP